MSRTLKYFDSRLDHNGNTKEKPMEEMIGDLPYAEVMDKRMSVLKAENTTLARRVRQLQDKANEQVDIIKTMKKEGKSPFKITAEIMELEKRIDNQRKQLNAQGMEVRRLQAIAQQKKDKKE